MIRKKEASDVGANLKRGDKKFYLAGEVEMTDVKWPGC